MFERIEVGSPNRPWATALAFIVNSTALTLAILLPMIRPDQLPAFVRVVTPPISVPFFHHDSPPSEPAPRRQTVASETDERVLRVPPTTSRTIDMSADRPTSDTVGPFIDHGIVPSNLPGMNSLPIASSNPPPMPVNSKPPRPQKLIISHLDEGMLLRRVQPAYPRIAISTRTQGSVVLSALINTRGEIEGLQVVSGPPLLVQAALEAVKQWRYRPYILNGTPIEVQTQVTVNFSLQ
jgi:periplasmic protein TonB